MRNRILNAGTTLALALTLGVAGMTGVALAGEDDTPPPPAEVPTTTVTVPVEVPGPTTTVTVPVPGPTTTVTVPVPAPETSSGSESGGSGSGSKKSSGSGSSRNTAALTFAGSGTDTGSIPQGGIQAGAGGTADNAPAPALVALVLALLAFGTAAGGVAMRRRGAQH